ncbi:phosphonate ABC transporter, permease protein PhnE [Chthonobacter rhizosphaerae]|uniref:phosphonate ABC transporter, permease protein PhnE n=1 Tax=Chthonobacter rhizosphaerae TaxID=2735553 RepID=UPI0015EE5618|nr:phosphonate ABC transporter, permease protein PhnE [Chthonobacter rhizosphaerae]
MTATTLRTLSAIAAQEAPRLRAAYPDVFRVDLKRRALTIGGIGLLVGLFALGLTMLETSWTRVFLGLGELGKFVVYMIPPDPGSWSKALVYLGALAETVAIAILGTVLAAILALPFGFLAARNVVPSWILRFLMRRSLDTIRSVDALIWALIWVNVVGLGPFAGVLAIMTSDFGTFGKLFSEAVEAADAKASEGIKSTGGSDLHQVRFGLLPQVLPLFASQVLYYIESNTRSATIIGIVGAGGIGLHLYEQIRTLEYQHVSFIIILVLAAVSLIDWVSSRLRFSVIGIRQT